MPAISGWASGQSLPLAVLIRPVRLVQALFVQSLFFAKWLKDHQLAPERIYSVHSHGFATMEHVNNAFEMSNASPH
jgi:hypothetical protein